ncbi:MAG TPA: hypothetical protein VI698_05795 [Nitrososphaerales archaeon]|nr:hypothetical protein [Nitrososphaerales archaeon]
MSSKIVFTVLMLLLSSLTFGTLIPAAAQQQMIITVPATGDTDELVLDGSWTTSDEWSKASETYQNYTDGTQLVIRGMHDGTFMNILLEMPQDYVVDGRAVICFDTLKDGGPYMESDDVCFVLGQNLEEFHGNGRTTLMQETGLIIDAGGKRGLSGSNSPYESGLEHVSYEFKIPINYIGGANQTQFGFYVVYETRGETTNYTYHYSWPDYESSSSLRVAPPRSWGMISISSTAEVPEFPLPLVGLFTGLIAMIAVASWTIRIPRR